MTRAHDTRQAAGAPVVELLALSPAELEELCAEWRVGTLQVCTLACNMRSRGGVRVVNVLLIGRKTCMARCSAGESAWRRPTTAPRPNSPHRCDPRRRRRRQRGRRRGPLPLRTIRRAVSGIDPGWPGNAQHHLVREGSEKGDVCR